MTRDNPPPVAVPMVPVPKRPTLQDDIQRLIDLAPSGHWIRLCKACHQELCGPDCYLARIAALEAELARVQADRDRLADFAEQVIELARGDSDTPIGTLNEIRSMKAELASVKGENDRLKAECGEWWRAATDVLNATDDDSPEYRKAWGDLHAMKTGTGWSQQPPCALELAIVQQDRSARENGELRVMLGRCVTAMDIIGMEATTQDYDDANAVRAAAALLVRTSA